MTTLDFENIQKSHEKNIEGDKILIVLTVTKVYLNSGLNYKCLEKVFYLTISGKKSPLMTLPATP